MEPQIQPKSKPSDAVRKETNQEFEKKVLIGLNAQRAGIFDRDDVIQYLDKFRKELGVSDADTKSIVSNVYTRFDKGYKGPTEKQKETAEAIRKQEREDELEYGRENFSEGTDKPKPGLLKKLGSGASKTLQIFGTPSAAAGFAGLSVMDSLKEGKSVPDAVIDKEVGVELLFPELAKRTVGKAVTGGPGILSQIGRVAANPFFKAARVFTPAGAVITAAGLTKDAYNRIKELEAMDPDEREALRKEREGFSFKAMVAGAADGGLMRTGFADGPQDPSKRKFMQIFGGLASLPILGRFFKIGERVEPIVQNLFTEIKQLKNTTTEMPEWFPSFLNKFRKEGKAENVFKTKKVEVSKKEFDQAFKEGKGENYYTDVARTPEYKANNPDHMDYYKRVDTDELLYTTYTNEKVPGVRVDDMDGNVDVMFENDYSQPVSLNYTAPGKRGPETGRADLFVQGEAKMETKPKGEFVANDVETYATDPDGGFEAEDVIVDSLDDMMEGKTRQMEEYVTGKKTKLSKGEGKVIQAEIRAEQAAESAREAAEDSGDFD